MCLDRLRRILISVTVLCLLEGACLGGVVSAAGVGEETNGSEDALAALVREFLKADADARRALEDRILAHPHATLETVSALLEQGRPFGRMPVGLQPDQEITVRGNTYRFGLYVPPSYDPARPYGLIVCLHGAGFTGDTYLTRWVPRLKDGYVLVCPTMSYGTWWTRQAEELVLATIATIQSRYHIDPDRIFLTGMSNGGIGAWIIGMHRADRFAGIAPMAGGIDRVLYPFLDNLRNTSVYVIHGLYDTVMPVWLSRELVNEMASRGIRYVYREHNYRHPHAGGHFFPREELPPLIEWFDVQRRQPLPRHVTVVRDATHLHRFSWVRIDMTERIAAFSDDLIDSRDALIDGQVYARLEARIREPNVIEIVTRHVRRLSLFLNQKLVDMAKPVIVRINGVVQYADMVHPRLRTLLHEARLRNDTSVLYSVHLPLDVPE